MGISDQLRQERYCAADRVGPAEAASLEISRCQRWVTSREEPSLPTRVPRLREHCPPQHSARQLPRASAVAQHLAFSGPDKSLGGGVSGYPGAHQPLGFACRWLAAFRKMGDTTGILIRGSKSHWGGRMEDRNHTTPLKELWSAFRFYGPLYLFPCPGNPATSKKRTVLATDRVLISFERPLFSSRFPAINCEKLQSSRWTRDFDFPYLYITRVTKLQNTLDIHWGFWLSS